MINRFSFTGYYTLILAAVLVIPGLLACLSAQAARPPAEPDLSGLHMAITGRERSDREARELIHVVRWLGVAWTRQEISQTSWGNTSDNNFFYVVQGQKCTNSIVERAQAFGWLMNNQASKRMNHPCA